MMSDQSQEAIQIKKKLVFFLGQSASGKTTIINKLCNRDYKNNYSPTLGFQSYMCQIKINKCMLLLQIWECSGKQLFKPTMYHYLQKSDIVCIVYDPQSNELLQNCNHINVLRNAPNKLVRIIERQLSDVKEIKYKPSIILNFILKMNQSLIQLLVKAKTNQFKIFFYKKIIMKILQFIIQMNLIKSNILLIMRINHRFILKKRNLKLAKNYQKSSNVVQNYEFIIQNNVQLI